MKYFEHKLPCDPSSMTNWRKRAGEAGAEKLLEEKDIRFSTDARLYDRARERLVKAAKERQIPLRQNYKTNSLKTKQICPCKSDEKSKEINKAP